MGPSVLLCLLLAGSPSSATASQPSLVRRAAIARSDGGIQMMKKQSAAHPLLVRRAAVTRGDGSIDLNTFHNMPPQSIVEGNGPRRIDIAFGFKYDKQQRVGRGEHKSWTLGRPAFVKAENWDGSNWVECSKRKQCWHGTEMLKPGRKSPTWPVMKIEVQANSEFQKFAFEGWARCTDPKGKPWRMTPFEIVNGDLQLYLNGKPDRKLSRMQSLSLGASGVDTLVRVEFTPTVQASRSRAVVKIGASGVSDFVDACMGTKFCLRVFGDGSDAGYEMRNVNLRMLDCLDNNEAAMSSDLRDECKKWKRCLKQQKTPTNKDLLHSILRAAIGNVNSTLLEQQDLGGKGKRSQKGRKRSQKGRGGKGKRSQKGRKRSQQQLKRMEKKPKGKESKGEECVDPATADPVTWECECLDEIKKECPKDKSKCDTVFRDHMCANCKVCLQWKRQHCSPELVQTCPPALIAAAMEARSEVSTLTVGGSGGASDFVARQTMDNTLSSKCT